MKTERQSSGQWFASSDHCYSTLKSAIHEEDLDTAGCTNANRGYFALIWGNCSERVGTTISATGNVSHALIEPPLTVEEAEAYRVQAPEWVLRDEATRIERTYRFRSFGDAFAFVRGAGELAEAEFHHPDISFGWGYATVSLRTKKITAWRCRR